MPTPLCSLVVVQSGGLFPLKDCLDSVCQQTYPATAVNLILVDNGSDQEARSYVAGHPRLVSLRSDRSNDARALNLGIGASRGDYVAFVNHDVVLAPEWLERLVAFLEESPRAAAVGGKILRTDGRISSVGLEAIGEFRWRHRGLGQADEGQFEALLEVPALGWGSVLFRRGAVAEVGPVDEDFELDFKVVEYALRCRQRGWTLHYLPGAVSRLSFHASNPDSTLTDSFCSRNRLLLIAKHSPRELSRALESPGEQNSIPETLPYLLETLLNGRDHTATAEALLGLCETAARKLGPKTTDGLLARAQVRRGHRRISIGFYDHALHLIGGGQKYAATMAEILQDEFDVTLIANRPVRIEQLEAWYDLDLSRCRLKVVGLPYFELQEIDPCVVADERGANPFQPMCHESSGYDIFVNANMADKVVPYSPLSLFICHFPVSRVSEFFSVHRYSRIVSSGQYGANWCRKRWGLHPSVLYPAVEADGQRLPKERVILSAGRFERTGSKKQLELIHCYRAMLMEAPELCQSWRLVLVGGTFPHNAYFEEIVEAARAGPGSIEVLPNLPLAELKAQYARADLFWHACGLDEIVPERIEHFGMTTVEAMQNRCVPIVIGAGGQTEIVEHARSGLLFNSSFELCRHSLRMLRDEPARERLRQAAWQRGQQFGRAPFEAGVRRLFGALRDEMMDLRRPGHLPAQATIASPTQAKSKR